MMGKVGSHGKNKKGDTKCEEKRKKRGREEENDAKGKRRKGNFILVILAPHTYE